MLLSAGLLAAALVVAVAWWWTHRSADRVVASQVRRRCVVTCKSGESFQGVLNNADRHSVVLTHTVDLAEDAPVDGELLILRADVAFIQLL